MKAKNPKTKKRDARRTEIPMMTSIVLSFPYFLLMLYSLTILSFFILLHPSLISSSHKTQICHGEYEKGDDVQEIKGDATAGKSHNGEDNDKE